MTKKEFWKTVSNSEEDVLQILLDAIEKQQVEYCVIGGLAVNAYVEPVVSLDLDIVIAAEKIEDICKAVRNVFKIEHFEHSVNLNSNESDLRIQLQTDARYQAFISRAEFHNVLGYKMKVAQVENVLQGKIWAYSDDQKRASKRQKDLADILRLIESYPYLVDQLPDSIREKIE